MKTDSELILELLACGKFTRTLHARNRARERGVRSDDIANLGNTGLVYPSDLPGRYRVVGRDLDGDPLTAIVLFESGLLIITVY